MSADPTWPDGVGRIVVAEVSTTMDAVRAHAPGPAWLLAETQTAARGRRGRAWENPPGNFSASLVMRVGGPPGQAALRSFIAALALRDAFVAATGREDAFQLKWPNDVLLMGGKVAGILLENEGDILTIGIGINLIAAPPVDALEPGAVRPVSLAAATGTRIEPEALLDLLAPAFARWEAVFQAQGFAPIRVAWLAHAARMGEVITARMGRRSLTGTFETIDDDGQIVLATPTGRQTLPAAEITF